MHDKLKHAMWNLVRPIHAPITRALRRRLGRNYSDHPEMELPPPYEAIQLDVERHLHEYLHTSPGEISQIVIVGALDAGEVGRMQRIYSRARFLCFEPNPRTYQSLTRKFAGVPNVSISGLALGRTSGKAQFYELSLAGNGSLLEPDVEDWAAATKQSDKRMTSFEVEVSTLDREAADLPGIDLLWMDVQGAEGEVLAGGLETLERTKAVFVEVELVHSPYKGALLFTELKSRLEAKGFLCVGLGVDAWNGTGNAFFVKQFEKLITK
jgi:2-O-methyltransferase